MKGTIEFLKSFATDRDVASITPSSKYCVRKLSEHINFSTTDVIVEYGGGTGVFTKHFLKKMRPDARLFVFETNDNFYDLLNSIDDDRLTVFHQTVEDLLELLPADVVGSVDHVVSGIPFSFFDWEMKIDILSKTREALRPEGSFLAYQTSGHLKDPLQEAFGNFTTEFCWKNIPPYFIYDAVNRVNGASS
ncbi:class I SAM-dependent methyltransferase [Gracilimonas mengyeensis]|uniref:Phospholipid N-methyltransferase n=1 Tax=Gracilimonas mengyeensis TaxID=1302730 RepID=A0A521CYS6_9BACT|nr:rRNA adenine N-6-methyltransferase family protein [Gracilimonas mengyeensis]SMO63911.1 Phospholipid N-methyltransferase [Gracilimonas mengyeensis]